ncbi:zinc finger C3HC4-type RING finger family protein [Striga asiatica]|uniref:Zinc finger C3HC4-type RING finger family protein n=1 Tax=Striga asiatica TaxID=4170 RepID=A0A5A7PXZ6_STRAF|nr:zinc finger C3HC4-type RING finger family protein [Striga asiatica]
MTDNDEKLPLLMTSHGTFFDRQSFYSLVDGQWKTIVLFILCGKRILGSGHGWLVLVDYLTGESCLWNPVLMREIGLPCLQDALCFNRCVLTGPPNEPDCHVVFCSTNLEERTVFRVRDSTTVSSPPREADELIRLIALTSF